MKFKFFPLFIILCLLVSCKEEYYNLTVLVEDTYTKQQVTDANVAFDSHIKIKSDIDGTFRLEEVPSGNYQLVCSKEGYLKFDSIISIPEQRNIKIKLQPLITLIAKSHYLDFGKGFSQLTFKVYNPYDDTPTKEFEIKSPSPWITITPNLVPVERRNEAVITVTVNRSKMPDLVNQGHITVNIKDANNPKNTSSFVTVKAEK